MRRCTCTFQPAIVVAIVLFLTSSSVWAQTTVTPRASTAGVGTNSPISPFLFGPPAYPYRATAPSSYRGTSLPDQPGGGGYRGPSLSVSAPARPPALGLSTTPLRSQPAIGAFVGFGQTSSLLSMDSDALLPGKGYRPAADKRAHISLYVPPNAQVWFDGQATKQTGKVREFHSPELTPGKTYHYEIRVRWVENGEPKERKQRIEVEARDWLRFDFTRPATP